MIQTLEIKPNNRGGHDIYLDGKEIPKVRKLTLDMEAGCLNTIRMELATGQVNAVAENTVVKDYDQPV